MVDRYHAHIERSRMNAITRRWQAAGHPQPAIAATQEMGHLIALERFRDFASERYLEDPTLTRTQIKAEYYDWVTKDTHAHSPDAREALETEMAAVAAMQDCFVGEARALFEAKAETELRQNIASASGRKGRPAYETRARRGWA